MADDDHSTPSNVVEQWWLVQKNEFLEKLRGFQNGQVSLEELLTFWRDTCDFKWKEGFQAGFQAGCKEGWRKAKGRKKPSPTAKSLIDLVLQEPDDVPPERRASKVLDNIALGRFLRKELRPDDTSSPDEPPSRKAIAKADEFQKKLLWRRLELVKDLPSPGTLAREMRRQAAKKK